jgi:hypothetical protein
VRIQDDGGGQPGVQQEVQHPALGCGTLRPVCRLVHELRRVGAHEIVQAEPTGRVLVDQVRPDQLGEQLARTRRRHVSQAGRRAQTEVRTEVQTEQAEQPRDIGREGAQRPREHRAHAAGRVACFERVEDTLLGPQFTEQVRQ